MRVEAVESDVMGVVVQALLVAGLRDSSSTRLNSSEDESDDTIALRAYLAHGHLLFH